jgi:hypothetical protein
MEEGRAGRGGGRRWVEVAQRGAVREHLLQQPARGEHAQPRPGRVLLLGRRRQDGKMASTGVPRQPVKARRWRVAVVEARDEAKWTTAAAEAAPCQRRLRAGAGTSLAGVGPGTSPSTRLQAMVMPCEERKREVQHAGKKVNGRSAPAEVRAPPERGEANGRGWLAAAAAAVI